MILDFWKFLEMSGIGLVLTLFGFISEMIWNTFVNMKKFTRKLKNSWDINVVKLVIQFYKFGHSLKALFRI